MIKRIPFIAFYVIGIILFFAAWEARGDEKHHHEQKAPRGVEVNVSSQALSIAASQHHYKATTSLQWSIGAGHNNDSSAASFGLEIQSGKVFVSGNVSFDGSSSAIGVGASGTF